MKLTKSSLEILENRYAIELNHYTVFIIYLLVVYNIIYKITRFTLIVNTLNTNIVNKRTQSAV